MKNTLRIIRVSEYWTRESAQADTDHYYVFGDNEARTGNGGQACVRGLANAFGIPTKKSASTYWSDDDFDSNVAAIEAAIAEIPIDRPWKISQDGLGTGLADLPRVAPLTYRYLVGRITEMECDGYAVPDGCGLMLRSCTFGRTGHHNHTAKSFVYPERGYVECEDWDDAASCGGGIHGVTRGVDQVYDPSQMFQVIEYALGDAVDLGDKIKIPRGTVLLTGDAKRATDMLKLFWAGTLNYSHNSGGNDSHNSGGHRSHNSGGHRSHNSGGDYSHNSGGDNSRNSGGNDSHNYGGDGSHNSGGRYSHNSGGDGSHNSGGYGSHNSGGDGSHNYGGYGSRNYGGDGSHNYGGDYSHNYGGRYSHNYGGYGSRNSGGGYSHNSGGDGSHNSGGRYSHNSGGRYSHNSGGDGSHNSGGGYSHNSGGDYSHNSGGDGSHNSGGGYSHNSGGDGSATIGLTDSRVAGGEGSALFIANWEDTRYRGYAANVGETTSCGLLIEPHVFYTVTDGKWVTCADQSQVEKAEVAK